MNRSLTKAFLLTVCLSGSWLSHSQVITTVAGDGNTAGTGNSTGGSNSVAVDTAGNIYIATGGLNTIRKVTPANVTTTFAGTGAAGFSGDNGPAANAAFRNIQDLFIAENQLYIADAGNRRIRRIDLGTGTVTTVAGDGSAGITGNGIGGTAAVAVDSLGNIYVAGGGIPVIRKITPSGVHSTFAGLSIPGFSGDNLPAFLAQFNLPSDLFVARSKLYIADTRNRRIRRIDLNTGIITTVAGDGTTAITGNGIGAATGVAVDGGENIFVATGAGGNAVRKISGSTYTTLTGGTATGGFGGDNGSPAAATLNMPSDVYIAGTNLYVADLMNRRIRQLTNTTVPLPLFLLQFTGRQEAGHTVLAWTTAAEKNVAGFDIERSSDARLYEAVGYTAATGNGHAGQQHYTFNDLSPLQGTSFYRLKIKDTNGSFTYSNIVSVTQRGDGGILLSPVPARQQLSIRVTDEQLKGTTARITDISGRELLRFSLETGQQLSVASWAPGMYFLKLADGTVLRFIKE